MNGYHVQATHALAAAETHGPAILVSLARACDQSNKSIRRLRLQEAKQSAARMVELINVALEAEDA